jgi:uncharacterized protein (DUF697 family)
MSFRLPDFEDLSRRLGGAVNEAWRIVVSPERDAAGDADIAAKAAAVAPVVWLLGKVQSGKSSIVRALTGASEAEVGSGFKACTPTARIFDFPAGAPLIRFLDTRGLGEAGYDPAQDIAFAEGQAHLLLVVMKSMDTAQAGVFEVVAEARRRHSDWPVLVAQTCLHEAYAPRTNHPERYMFDAQGQPLAMLPGDLQRTLGWQRKQAAGLPGTGPIAFVPLDFTQPGDGYEPRLYGMEALRSAIVNVAPGAVATALAVGEGSAMSARTARARQHILGFASAAAAADVVPVAGAVAVPAVQAKMLHSLGEIHGVAWDRRMVGEISGALGAGVLVRMAASFGARQLGKLVPVYGQTAGAAAAAAMSFATTYALGTAASVYLERRGSGQAGIDGVKEAYDAALRTAFDMAAQKFKSAPTDGPSPGGRPA